MKDNERAFLIGLEKLSRKTGIVISGCGCCGSPTLDAVRDMPPEAGYAFGAGNPDVAWVSPLDSYDWDNFREKIVKANAEISDAKRSDD